MDIILGQSNCNKLTINRLDSVIKNYPILKISYIEYSMYRIFEVNVGYKEVFMLYSNLVSLMRMGENQVYIGYIGEVMLLNGKIEIARENLDTGVSLNFYVDGCEYKIHLTENNINEVIHAIENELIYDRG